MSVVGAAAAVSAATGVAGLAMSGGGGDGGGARIPGQSYTAMDDLLGNAHGQLNWFNKAYRTQWKPAQERAAQLGDVVAQRNLDLSGRAADMGAQAWQKGLDLWGQADAFKPVTAQVAQDALGWDSAAQLDKVAGEAAADATRAGGLARQRTRDDLARYGASPTSGRALALEARAGIDEAAATAGAMNAARESRRGQGAAMRLNAAGLGLNLVGAGNQAAQLAGGLNVQSGGLAGQAQAARGVADNYILQGAGLKEAGYRGANSALEGVVSAGNQIAGLQNQATAINNANQNAQMQGWGQLAGLGLSYLKPDKPTPAEKPASTGGAPGAGGLAYNTIFAGMP